MCVCWPRDVMRSSLATCPTNAINTVHSYDLYRLYQQSPGGHTQVFGSLSKTGIPVCCLLSVSNYTFILEKKSLGRSLTHRQAHSHAGKNAHTLMHVARRGHVRITGGRYASRKCTHKHVHNLEKTCIYFQPCGAAELTVAACAFPR